MNKSRLFSSSRILGISELSIITHSYIIISASGIFSSSSFFFILGNIFYTTSLTTKPMFIWNFMIVLKSSIFSSPIFSLSFSYLSIRVIIISSRETLIDHYPRAIIKSAVIYFLLVNSLAKNFSDSFIELSLNSSYLMRVG